MNKEMKISFPGGKRVFSDYNGFSVETDQSKEDGGDNSAPTPSELFFASIGTCTAFYALRFCESRKIDTAKLKIKIELQSNPKTHMVEKIFSKLICPRNFLKNIPPQLSNQ